MTIKDAAKTTGMNCSTARMIFKKYQETGKIFERKDQQRDRKIREAILQ
jgi:transposase